MKPPFELDPEWEMKTIKECHPRSPQAITLDGVLVGYRHEPDLLAERSEQVMALGDEDAPLAVALQQWWVHHCEQEEARRKQKAERLRARNNAEWAEKEEAARSAFLKWHKGG